MQKIVTEVEKLKIQFENYQVSDNSRKLVKEFMESKARCLLGRNEYSESVCKKIKIDYVIDDFAPEGSMFCGVKVIRIEDVPEDVVVVSCVLSTYVSDVLKKMKANKINKVISYSDLAYEMDEIFEFPNFVKEARAEFSANPNKFQELFNALNDELSKKTLSDVLLYRLTANGLFLKDYKVDLEGQYFADAEFLDLQSGEVFL